MPKDTNPNGANAPHPTTEEWAAFLSRSLLLLGTVLCVAGVAFFFASNWQGLERLAKLGLAGAAVLGTALAAWRLGLRRLSGRVALTAAAALVGVFIDLYNQLYQAAANAWENDALWAVLILPWAVIGRFSPLALLWVGVVDLALADAFRGAASWDNSRSLFAVGLFNACMLAAWERARLPGKDGEQKRWGWLDGTWGPRLLLTSSLLALLMPSLEFLYDERNLLRFSATVVLLAVAAAVLYVYRSRISHPAMLALALAFLVTLVTAGAAKLLVDESHLGPEEAFRILGLAVFLIFEVAASTWWLRRVTLKGAAP